MGNFISFPFCAVISKSSLIKSGKMKSLIQNVHLWTRWDIHFSNTHQPVIKHEINNTAHDSESHTYYPYLFSYCGILFIYLFIYLFMGALGLRCCVWAFSSCVIGGYSSLQCAGFSLRWLFTGSRRAGFSSCGSRALERRFSSCGEWA